MSPFVQCPACGGQVHAIASKCKHCKADLLKFREDAERARRNQNLRQTDKASPPPVSAAPRRAPSSPAGGGGSRPNPVGQAPQIVYAQPSGWARSWPIAVSAVAVVAIVVSLVILLRDKEDDNGQLPSRSDAVSPHLVPDDMPSPTMPSPGGPHGTAPTPPDPTGPTPKAWTTAPDPGMFPVALTETVCAKLEDCGFRDDFSNLLCRELAKGMSNPDLDDKVKNGQCSYDRTAASACLQAIDRISCDLSSGQDVTALLDQASELFDCSSAYVCN